MPPRVAVAPTKPVSERPIGAHAPVAGGLAKGALPYLDQTSAEVVQVFVSNPRGWTLTDGDPRQDEAFVAGCAERSVPAYIHASYLVNLGSPTAATVERSGATLAHALRRGAQIGAKGVVFHAGSAVDEQYAPTALRQVREVLLPLLDEAAHANGPRLLVEPTAGGGRCLAARVEDLAAYLEAVDWHPMLGVCLDTCHVWAAGHNLATPGGMTDTLGLLLDTVGPDRLGLIHANDSRDTCGSLRDRHETIGAGTIGEGAFAEMFRHPSTSGVPIVVETPSTGYTGHAADIATLTRLRTAAGLKTRRPAKAPSPTAGKRRRQP
jgi:deoxyribonuclease-4